MYTIPIKKIEQIAMSDRFFGLFLVISEVLYSKNSDFQDLSVLVDFYALYHFFLP